MKPQSLWTDAEKKIESDRQEAELRMKPQPEATHTPTPWKVTKNGCISTHDEQICIAIAPTYGIEEFKTDAAFICRAVNAHEELLDALREFVAFTECYCTDGKNDCAFCIGKQAIAKAEK